MDQAEQQLTEHLQRASELLRGDKLDEAEREIGSALSLRGDDLRARNLRGLFLFRAGRYEEARSAYLQLSEGFPDDTALRLNLGLVELRMGRFADASSNLKRVVDVEPDNARAQGYLGLALMRAGDLSHARDAFIRGGQTELAKQVEERMAQADEALAVRGELRRAAGEGERVLGKDQPFAAVELEAPVEEARRSGAWQLRVPGERPPLPGPEGVPAGGSVLPLLLEPPRPVAAFATARLLRPGGMGDPFALAEGGMLVLRVDGRLPTRTFGAIASTGQLTFEPLQRRVRGQAVDEPFGEGAEAMFVSVGKGLMVVAPRGARFTLLALADDIVYVREQSLFAFEESLHWENGRVPGGGPDSMRVVQFRGTGRLVARTERAAFTLKIEADAPLYVDSSTLLGWIGRVVPRVLHSEGGAPTPYIECTGEGVLILEEPAAL
ncbi:MAG TPA: tetratricopeptide repeat protein [Polyangia bacterium]|nr:tetratricopeptide repeat protein [Polyangia bacterium]